MVRPGMVKLLCVFMAMKKGGMTPAYAMRWSELVVAVSQFQHKVASEWSLGGSSHGDAAGVATKKCAGH